VDSWEGTGRARKNERGKLMMAERDHEIREKRRSDGKRKEKCSKRERKE
jgi:hypothetical protein